MKRLPNRRKIGAKLSAIPPKRSVARAYLDAYKLQIEKDRLQQELQYIETRRSQIQERIAVIEKQLEAELGQTPLQESTNQSSTLSEEIVKTQTFKMLTLEY